MTFLKWLCFIGYFIILAAIFIVPLCKSGQGEPKPFEGKEKE